MEKNEHLTYFKVKNFKRFEEFELNDITQFNIIVGDNNIGKTTLLEALLFAKNINHQLHSLFSCFNFKISEEFSKKFETITDIVNYIFPLFYNNKEKKEFVFEVKNYNNKKKSVLIFEIKSYDELSSENKKFLLEKGRNTKGNIIILSENNVVIDIKSQEDINLDIPYLPYIPFTIENEDGLLLFYSKYIQQNKKTKIKFIESLKSFIPNIETVEITTRFMKHPVIEVFEKFSNEPKLLSTYGDGANKLFRILAEIIASRGKRLMIDEIDTGIHYSRFEKFWKIVLKTAKEYDVQLFATTHNPDCLNYLVDALENEDMQSYQKDTSVFALDELPDKTVKSFKHDFETFKFLTNKGIEFRGGKNE